MSDEILGKLQASRASARSLRALPSEAKNLVLAEAARALVSRQAEILAANSEDLQALEAGTDEAFRDRLLLDPKRIAAMAESLRQVQALADPVGEVVESKTLANGLRVKRERAPLGVIFMIFESRPNVAIEAFSLAFKAGNATILRGGKESRRTVGVLYDILQAALASTGAARECLWGVVDPDRALVEFLLKQKQWIDVVVPRGGDGLIDYVTKTSLIPVIKNDRGLCHVYVHEDADLAMAERIVVNSKTQRPGVCNSMETVLVHASRARAFLPSLHAAMPGVSWYGCDRTLAALPGAARVERAQDASYDNEYLALKMNCRVVDSFEQAVEHIEKHGSRHSEAIVTASRERATAFEGAVDAAAVYWNASTRFTDGFELGLGGELGISTQKLHVRGPVGLRELTSVRWIVEGDGQIRN